MSALFIAVCLTVLIATVGAHRENQRILRAQRRNKLGDPRWQMRRGGEGRVLAIIRTHPASTATGAATFAMVERMRTSAKDRMTNRLGE